VFGAWDFLSVCVTRHYMISKTMLLIQSKWNECNVHILVSSFTLFLFLFITSFL